MRVGSYGGWRISVTSAARRWASRAGSRVPRMGSRLWTSLYAISVSQPCGKSGNRNGRSEMAGPLAWPRMPRKIPSSWICGCDRSDTMDNETAWPGLSRMKGDWESSEARALPFKEEFVSPLSSRAHNKGYGVFCLSHESCRSGAVLSFSRGPQACAIRRWRLAFGKKSRCG